MHIRRLSQTKLALGSDVTLSIVTDMSTVETDVLFMELWNRIFIFEKSFSRFLPMSELTTFNRSSGIKSTITPEFKNLLLSAKKMSIETNGLYNPFITPALQKAGYKKSAVPGYEQDAQTDYTDRRVVEAERLEIGDVWAQIPYGTALDMGGIGKGYLANQLGVMLNRHNIHGYWLSLGGDIVTKGVDENGNMIRLDIQSANNLVSTTNWIINCPEKKFAVATSGTFRRKGQDVSQKWHHIINPETQKPAVTDICLATVCADTCESADVLASCAIIMGSDKAPIFLKQHGIKSVLLQCIDEKGTPFDIVFGRNIKMNNPAGVFQNA